MARIPHVPLPVFLGLLLLVSGAGIYGYGWYLDTTRDCADHVTIDRVEEPSSAGATNFSALTHDQQGVFLLGLDEDDGGHLYTTDDEILHAADALPSRVSYEGTSYTVTVSRGTCLYSPLPQTAGFYLISASVLVFAAGGVISLVRRERG